MSLKEDILIENYLKDILSESEKKEFLVRMSVDTDFKEKVVFEKQLFETLNENDWNFSEKGSSKEIEHLDNIFKSDEVRKVKEAISIANKEYLNKEKPNNRLIYFIAASIAVLISVYSLFFTVSETPKQLYAEYIQTKELYSNINRGEVNSLDELASAEFNFKNKNYKKALPIFIKELEKDKENASLYLCTAVSQIELNKYTEAKKTLDNLINSDLIDAQKGYWYKSLLFVKSSQLEEAKQQLVFIIENSYFKHQEAKELLSKLGN